MNPILPAAEVAKLLDCSLETVETAARDGKLPGVKYGRQWVFPAQALLDALNKQAAADAAKRRVDDPGLKAKATDVGQTNLGVGRKAANSPRMRPRPALDPLPELPGLAAR